MSDSNAGDRRQLKVLALNSGSSSLKVGLYEVGSLRTDTLLSGEVEGIGETTGTFQVKDSQNNSLVSEAISVPGPREAVVRVASFFADAKLAAPDAIGHRIVHGGPQLRQHCLIDGAVLRQLEAATAFAPLHTPPALSVIRFAQEHFPGLPQVACFDTTFHAKMPERARVLPLPRELREAGIQRYGFHGLSCESIMHQLVETPVRLIIAHLGNGASVTAVKDGVSIDTSMGLTPTGGVIMGTRSGDLDPGVLVYLAREMDFDAAMLEQLVDHRSGLLGISGIGSDMRALHKAAVSNAEAGLAVEMFCYSVRKQIAAMIAALGGLDLLVFTGGIGENDTKVRAAICDGLTWAGIDISATQNGATGRGPGYRSSRCQVEVLASQEDEQIARHTWELVS